MKFGSIILLGPLASGKSTIAHRLSERLGIPNYPVDKLKWYYRFKNGYDLAESKRILEEYGFEHFLDYAKQFFTVSDLKQLLQKFPGIVDLGATDSCTDNDYDRQRQLERLFSDYSNKFLIMPSASVDWSEEILTERLKKRYENHPVKRKVLNSYLDMNYRFLTSLSNYSLANKVVYVEDHSIDEVCEEIILHCKQNGKADISNRNAGKTAV